MTVLDELVLQFGLDHRDFDKGQRDVLDELRKFEDAAAKSGTRAEEGGKRVADVMGGLRREALGVLGLFLGGMGIKEFIGHMTELDASTGKAAQMLNMSARELSAWQGVMEQSGGSAQAMTGTLQGITGDMNKFMLTGQGTLASVLRPFGISMFDNNKQLKDAGTLLLELSDAVQKMDPARATAFLSMIPGMNQDSISLLLRGRHEMEEMLLVSRQMGGTTAESAEQAKQYQQAIANLDRSMSSLGRTLVTMVAPALSTVASSLSRLFASWNVEAGSAADTAQSTGLRGKLVSKFGSPRAVLEWLAENSPIKGDREYTLGLADRWYGPKGADEAGAKSAAAAGSSAAVARGVPASNAKEVEDYIRQAAIARKIDPDVAVQVAKSEGLFNYVGDRGSSFGPFQLHYGNVAGGGMAVGGLGDEFTKKTGLDARDESTWKKQVDFSLDKASSDGWTPWHGWRGAKFAGMGGRAGGGSQSTSTTTVGTIVINTQATDAKGIAADIKPQLERGSFTSQFNSGLE